MLNLAAVVRQMAGFLNGAALAIASEETNVTQLVTDGWYALWTRDSHGESSPTFHEFSSFVSAVDLTGKGFGYCRRLVIHTAGTVTLVGRKAYTGAGDTITVADGDVLDVEATSIASVSGVTAITVYW